MITRIFCIVLFPFCVLGCGTSEVKIVPVSGTVTLNGSPVEEATVTFLPPSDSTNLPATAKTDADGKFALTTRASGDGAMVGSYRVKVTKYSTGAGISPYDDAFATTDPSDIPEPVTTNAIPDKYAIATTSGLTYDVVDSEAGNTVTLELTGEVASASDESQSGNE